MGISENICTRQSLRRGDVRLAVSLNKGEKLHKVDRHGINFLLHRKIEVGDSQLQECMGICVMKSQHRLCNLPNRHLCFERI